MHLAAPTAMIRPPRLRAGSRVALIAPAGPIAEDRVAIALDRCARLGLEPVLGRAARNRHGGYLAGTDDERLADLNRALADPDITAVWALRGGYGTMRLLPRLQLESMVHSPRAFIGFSDNTALHLALRAHDLVSFHGPNAGSTLSDLAEHCLRRVLFDQTPAGLLDQPADTTPVALAPGTAEGPLIGGNLALLAALCGTAAAPIARGAILFMEDVREPAYRIDRAWTQLLLAGALDGVAGILFGQFTECEDVMPDLLQRLAAPLGVPVLAGLPIGHEADNWTLPLGVRVRMDTSRGTVELLESGVS